MSVCVRCGDPDNRNGSDLCDRCVRALHEQADREEWVRRQYAQVEE